MPDFSWIAKSRKAQVAIGTLVSVLGVRGLSKAGFSVEQSNEVTTALSVVGSAWIAGIAIEDHGKKSAEAGDSPAAAAAGGTDPNDRAGVAK